MALPPSTLANLASCAVLLLFGIAVLAISQRRPRDIAFAVYASGFALGTAVANLQPVFFPAGPPILYEAARGALYGIGGLGGFALAWTLTGNGSSRPGARIAATAVFALAVFLPPATAGTDVIDDTTWSRVGFALLVAGPLAGAFLLALDYRATSTARRDERRELAVVAGALVIYPALYVTVSWTRQTTQSLALDQVVPMGIMNAGLVALIVVWALNGVGAGAKGPRNVALLCLLAGLAGLWSGAGPCAGQLSLCGVPAVARFLGVSILAYAILRHHLMGLDVKVRWGVSKSTIAGVFIAVFFVASEIAQQFFGERFESPYFGIVAAGALVFAIAPLSRLADRVAQKAIPIAAVQKLEPIPTAPSLFAPARSQQADELYREALRIALVDRRVTRAEELHLFRLAEHLGIGAGRAMELRHEIETQLPPAGGPPAKRGDPRGRA